MALENGDANERGKMFWRMVLFVWSPLSSCACLLVCLCPGRRGKLTERAKKHLYSKNDE